MANQNNSIGNTKPEDVPQEGHGGSNVPGKSKRQGKEGNGAQKRKQQKQ